MVFFGDHDLQVRNRPLTEKEKIPLFIAARVLFDELTEIDVVDGNVRSRRAPERMSLMLTSVRFLDS